MLQLNKKMLNLINKRLEKHVVVKIFYIIHNHVYCLSLNEKHISCYNIDIYDITKSI